MGKLGLVLTNYYQLLRKLNIFLTDYLLRKIFFYASFKYPANFDFFLAAVFL